MPKPAPSPRSPRLRIREAGLRATSPRIAVLEMLDGAGAPISPAEALVALGESHDRATVYRNLADLAEHGLLRRLDLGDGVQRYETLHRSARDTGHPHFVCLDCGTVRCLDEVQVTLTGAPLPPALAEADVSVRISGHCDDCRAAR